MMKAASISEIKNELGNCSASRLAALCLQLAKYKKDNKEFLTYLLFEEDDRDAYIAGVKKEIDEHFTGINSSQLYFAKKACAKYSVLQASTSAIPAPNRQKPNC